MGIEETIKSEISSAVKKTASEKNFASQISHRLVVDEKRGVRVPDPKSEHEISAKQKTIRVVLEVVNLAQLFCREKPFTPKDFSDYVKQKHPELFDEIGGIEELDNILSEALLNCHLGCSTFKNEDGKQWAGYTNYPAFTYKG